MVIKKIMTINNGYKLSNIWLKCIVFIFAMSKNLWPLIMSIKEFMTINNGYKDVLLPQKFVLIHKYHHSVEEVFNNLLGMIMISFGNFGTGKILYSSLKAHCKSCSRHKFSPFMA